MPRRLSEAVVTEFLRDALAVDSVGVPERRLLTLFSLQSSARLSTRRGLSKVGTSPSTIVGPRVYTTDWRDSPPISCAGKWPSLSRSVATHRPWQPRRRPRPYRSSSRARDPVRIGLVTNLHRPGGNITGASSFIVELEPKRLELVHDLRPNATKVAALVNPKYRSQRSSGERYSVRGPQMGQEITILKASTISDDRRGVCEARPRCAPMHSWSRLIRCFPTAPHNLSCWRLAMPFPRCTFDASSPPPAG